MPLPPRLNVLLFIPCNGLSVLAPLGLKPGATHASSSYSNYSKTLILSCLSSHPMFHSNIEINPVIVVSSYSTYRRKKPSYCLHRQKVFVISPLAHLGHVPYSTHRSLRYLRLHVRGTLRFLYLPPHHKPQIIYIYVCILVIKGRYVTVREIELSSALASTEALVGRCMRHSIHFRVSKTKFGQHRSGLLPSSSTSIPMRYPSKKP